MSANPRPASHQAFTLIEILIVIAVILTLVGLLLAAISVITRSVHRSATLSMVQNIQAAMSMYQIEDPEHRFPPMETDFCMRSNRNLPAFTNLGVLDMLLVYKVPWRPSNLDPTNALEDPFYRTFYYQSDYNASASASAMVNVTPWAPAVQPTDWNAENNHPYAYVWSLGQPTGNGNTYDLTGANVANWLYYKTTN